MPEKTKCDDNKQPKTVKKPSAEKPETDGNGNWCEDQKKKSYYYDDSYGYEIYNPDEEDDDEEE